MDGGRIDDVLPTIFWVKVLIGSFEGAYTSRYHLYSFGIHLRGKNKSEMRTINIFVSENYDFW